MSADVETVILQEKDFAVLVDLRHRTEEALARYNTAAEEAKSRKKAFEASREAFEREFDRLVAKTRGEDLPLFSQTDAIAAAENDPIVRQLVERLIDAGHDVNALQVFGYTENERNQVHAYLNALAEHSKAKEGGELNGDLPDVEVPPFLAGAPADADVNRADDLACELAEQGLEFTPRMLLAFTEEQRREIGDWLDTVNAVKAEKGESVTVDDLPPPPAFLLNPAAVDANASEPPATNGQDAPPEPVCAICGGTPAAATRKALNGLPVGVVACSDCRSAVKRRDVGVVQNEDGTLSITDGRSRDSAKASGASAEAS